MVSHLCLVLCKRNMGIKKTSLCLPVHGLLESQMHRFAITNIDCSSNFHMGALSETLSSLLRRQSLLVAELESRLPEFQDPGFSSWLAHAFLHSNWFLFVLLFAFESRQYRFWKSACFFRNASGKDRTCFQSQTSYFLLQMGHWILLRRKLGQQL